MNMHSWKPNVYLFLHSPSGSLHTMGVIPNCTLLLVFPMNTKYSVSANNNNNLFSYMYNVGVII